jgi:hypothetical protein
LSVTKKSAPTKGRGESRVPELSSGLAAAKAKRITNTPLEASYHFRRRRQVVLATGCKAASKRALWGASRQARQRHIVTVTKYCDESQNTHKSYSNNCFRSNSCSVFSRSANKWVDKKYGSAVGIIPWGSAGHFLCTTGKGKPPSRSEGVG